MQDLAPTLVSQRNFTTHDMRETARISSGLRLGRCLLLRTHVFCTLLLRGSWLGLCML